MKQLLDADHEETNVLQLSVDDWCNLLKNKEIFDEPLLEIMAALYYQPNHESTATDIALNFSLMPNRCMTAQSVTRCYVEASKKIYTVLGKSPKAGSDGQLRFWNTLFIMTKDPRGQKVKKDGHTLYRLILRPELVMAMERLQLVHR